MNLRPTANQRGPVSYCSARQVMFVVINDHTCRRRTLNVKCSLKLITAFDFELISDCTDEVLYWTLKFVVLEFPNFYR